MIGIVPDYVKQIMFTFRFERLDLNRQSMYAYEQNKGSYGYMFHVAPVRKRHFLSRSTHNLFDQFLKWAEKNGAEAQLLKVYEDPENRKGYAYMEVSITDPVAQFIEKKMEHYRKHSHSVSR